MSQAGMRGPVGVQGSTAQERLQAVLGALERELAAPARYVDKQGNRYYQLDSYLLKQTIGLLADYLASTDPESAD